jgi:hypothetical protein
MAIKLELRNPDDLTSTYDQIEIQKATSNSAAAMADISTNTPISTTYASDLSTGYTSYTDDTGVEGTHYYRFKYKNSTSGASSSYSDIFPAGGSVFHTRFRRRMRDTNSNNYFFTDDDIEIFGTEVVEEMYPITWIETYLDTMIVPDNSTKIFAYSSGVTRVTDIQRVDSDGNNQGSVKGWQIRGRYIIFDGSANSGNTYRCWVEKKFTKLAEIPEQWDGYILHKLMLKGYETLEADRARYYKYTSVVKPEGGNLPSLDKIITRLEVQIQRQERLLRRVRKPTDINLTGV